MPHFQNPSAIKGGVVGYGSAYNMGQQHLEMMRKHGVTPTAVAEIDPARQEVARQDFPGIETYDSLDDMLERSEVNLVVIITPHNSHAALVMKCLQAGRHVIVEKPMALTTEECDAMIATASEKSLILSTYHNRHWDGCILEARHRILEENAIGDVYKVSASWSSWSPINPWWRNAKSISGGILYDWGVHLLEYSLQILDGNLTEVSGFANPDHFKSVNPYKEDAIEAEAQAIARFDNGKWLSLNVTAMDHGRAENGVVFAGTEGSYFMQLQNWTIQKRGDDENSTRHGKNRESENWRYYDNIVKHLVEEEPLIITGEWSRRPIHIIDLAMQSAEKGCALPSRYA